MHLCPSFSNMDIIEKWRKAYDPLYGLIPPHITLCFPFESEITTSELIHHMQTVLEDISCFKLVLNGYRMHKQEYLFLEVTAGRESIINCHQRLYSGKLKDYFEPNQSYAPHLTIGRFQSPELLKQAYSKVSQFDMIFESEITSVLLERIRPDDSSEVEYIYDLNS